GRLRLVVRLEHLEEAVLGTQHDLPGAEARDVDRIVEPLEAERTRVDRDGTVEVADDQDESGEAGDAGSFNAGAPRAGGPPGAARWARGRCGNLARPPPPSQRRLA